MGGGYRLVERPPRAVDRVDLPEAQVAWLRAAEVRSRLTRLAGEVTSIAAWGDPAPVDDLAERLLIDDALVPELLAYAVSDHLIRHDPDGIRPLPRPCPESSRVPKPGPRTRRPGLGSGGVGGSSFAFVRPSGHDPGVALSVGDPPRVGVVTASRDVVVWRGSEPVVLGRVPDQHVHHAFETRDGIVVSASGIARLLRWDGELVPLPVDLGFAPVRSADGALLGGVQSHTGRHTWDQPHLLDLTTGEVSSLPQADGLTRRPVAVHGGALYFTEGNNLDATTYRWRPGEDPERLGPGTWAVDPLSGTCLSGTPGHHALHTPDGARHPLAIETPHHLAPGGTVYALKHNPNRIEVHHPAATHRLPDDVRLGPGGPVWESASTLVFPTQFPPRFIRWNVHTGHLDEHPLPSTVGHLPLPIAGILERRPTLEWS